MTREEARMELIRTKRAIYMYDLPSEAFEAIDMAIEALRREEAEEKGYCHRIKPSNVEVVVRCKDCRYWNSETKGCKRNPSVEAWQEDDFCKYGKRWSNAID